MEETIAGLCDCVAAGITMRCRDRLVAGLFDAEVEQVSLQQTLPAQVPYLQQLPPASRGKVLAVVSSTGQYPAARVGGKLKTTGYELTELARFYWVLRANGFAVDIASPQGGAAPQVLDDDDMAEYDYSFLNDPQSRKQSRNTLKLADVDPTQYQAVYFVGGKGAMYDFPQNPDIRRLLQQIQQEQGTAAAKAQVPQLVRQGPLQRDLLIMMALVSVMAGDWTESIKRLALAQAVKSQQQRLTP